MMRPFPANKQAQMRVNIDEIKEGGLQRSWDLTREAVDEMVFGDSAGYRAQAPLHVEGRFTKLERRVIFDARARACLTAPCGRCLAPVSVPVPVDFQVNYVQGDELRGHGAPEADGGEDEGRHQGRKRGTFGSDEVNEEAYKGKVIDLDPMLREQIVLALPSYPVCQESCKGLCSVCGANLNERDCGCDRHVPDPRWAGLAKKLEKKSLEKKALEQESLGQQSKEE
jgi:DUF177 domain-containing protein